VEKTGKKSVHLVDNAVDSVEKAQKTRKTAITAEYNSIIVENPVEIVDNFL